MLRVALISASPLLRAGLEAALDEFEVVLWSTTFAEARSAAFGYADVAIGDAADETDEMHTDGPPLVLLLRDEQTRLADCLSEGISVLPADAPGEAIAAAVMAAVQGLVVSTQPLMAGALRETPGARHPGIEPLTPRELEVLAQLALGLANREIGQALQISTHTAKFHVAQIIAKLAAKSRAHAVAKAMQAGIV